MVGDPGKLELEGMLTRNAKVTGYWPMSRVGARENRPTVIFADKSCTQMPTTRNFLFVVQIEEDSGCRGSPILNHKGSMDEESQ